MSNVPGSPALSDQEQKVMDCLVASWNAFVALPIQHGDDTTEFRHGIHRLQEKILARPARQKMNDREWL